MVKLSVRDSDLSSTCLKVTPGDYSLSSQVDFDSGMTNKQSQGEEQKWDDIFQVGGILTVGLCQAGGQVEQLSVVY